MGRPEIRVDRWMISNHSMVTYLQTDVYPTVQYFITEKFYQNFEKFKFQKENRDDIMSLFHSYFSLFFQFSFATIE